MRSESLLYSAHARRVVFFFIFLFLAPTMVQAASVADYQRNLKAAITALDTLTQTDEEESQPAYQQRFDDTLTNVRSLLPETQMVNCGEELCTVDNSWLNEGLKQMQQASEAD